MHRQGDDHDTPWNSDNDLGGASPLTVDSKEVLYANFQLPLGLGTFNDRILLVSPGITTSNLKSQLVAGNTVCVKFHPG
jgi:hypothetical protein